MEGLNDVRMIDLPSVRDARGVLTSIESGIDTPFEIKRIFYMHHIVSDRGGHAHTDTDQVIVASYGSFKVEISDGTDSRSFVLDDAQKGLYVPRMIFIKLSDFSPGAVCTVLASTHYDIKRSIRTWEDYLKAIRKDTQ
ncbi:MAG TPA: FdtA/QdtA family cupin domain-containing protein [Candidatus Omnitrophota bacterium]|nr:FdtA/QdtA family cupin domain-containing protein [Candidatus Omnitrophota bacterium]